MLKASEGHLTPFLAIGNGSPIGAIEGALKVWKLGEGQLMALADRVSSACSISWDAVKRQYGGPYLNPNQCANGIFIHTFLFDREGLGLRPHQVQAAKQVKGREPTWTRGYLMAERSQ
jgi:hypothetical protein